ncbi:MAG: HEAT repeat domain-containing protein [Candidatus Aminicenantes bacterium]|nr:MAG: HEAT repeat domain-containing protein [Candidatus Aminicenantes bacterium]
MKKSVSYIGVLILAIFVLHIFAHAQPDEKLFMEAKILIFDKEWKKAQEKLEQLIDEYPDSPLISQAVFYKAKCLKEQKGKERDALKAYQDYLERKDRSKSLAEDAETDIIELAYKLYQRGRRSYLSEIEKRLSSPNRVVRYFAAIKLSQVKDKRISAKAVPVLKEIIQKERDDELRDRAKIALLRIDPDVLKDLEDEMPERRALLLKIRVWKHGKLTLKINIPWALADLALGSMSEEERAELREEGYDLDTIIKTLIEEGEIIEIENPEEGTVIKIWIE